MNYIKREAFWNYTMAIDAGIQVVLRVIECNFWKVKCCEFWRCSLDLKILLTFFVTIVSQVYICLKWKLTCNEKAGVDVTLQLVCEVITVIVITENYLCMYVKCITSKILIWKHLLFKATIYSTSKHCSSQIFWLYGIRYISRVAFSIMYR